MKVVFVEKHDQLKSKPIYRRFSAGIIWLSLLFIATISVQIVLPDKIYAQSFERILTPPTWLSYISGDLSHPFGTDTSGRDVLIRCVAAFGVYLLPSAIAIAFCVGLGLALGVASSTALRSEGPYISIAIKVIRLMASSALNILEGMPKYLVILLLISALPNSGLTWIAAALGVLNSSKLGKVLCDKVKLIYKEDFVEAALAVGISQKRLILKHILICYTLPIIIIQSLMQLLDLILVEVALSYLGAVSDWSYGITVPEPRPSWGNILIIGRDHLIDGWWISLFPILILAATVSSIQLVSYRLCRIGEPLFYGQNS